MTIRCGEAALAGPDDSAVPRRAGACAHDQQGGAAAEEFEASVGLTWAQRAALPDALAAVTAPGGNERKNRVRHMMELAALRHYIPRPRAVETTVDFGCGVGRFFPWLLGHTSRLWGLEITPGMLERARDRFGGDPRVTLRLFDGRTLPGELGTVDRLFCCGVLRDIFVAHRDVYRAIGSDWHERLSPGGEIIQLEMFVQDVEPERFAEDFLATGLRLELLVPILRYKSRNISRAARRLGFPLIPAIYVRREIREAANWRGTEPADYLFVYRKP
jgi:SAM-dependent methyltransferase